MGMTPWRRAAIRVTLPLRRRWLSRRVGRLVCEQVEGLRVVVLPEVFNPAVFGSSDILVRALRASTGSLGAGCAPGRLLDMGTGTGLTALAGAALGYHVVAVDANPEAVRCARMNALLHHAEARVDVRCGDLFAPVAGERFDVVTFNPPFFDGEPRSLRDRAWRSRDVPERFGADLPGALAPAGRALVVTSSHGGAERTTRAIEAAGLRVAPLTVTDLGYETVTVIEARHPEAVS
jgi:release factor glutamine methyltransferase